MKHLENTELKETIIFQIFFQTEVAVCRGVVPKKYVWEGISH